MRIDLLLARLRFAKSRSIAQARIAQAYMRCNGTRVTRQDHDIAVGDVLTLPQGRSVLVVEILALPVRRGPAVEARSCYRVLDAGGSFAIAEQKSPEAAMD
jgi:ribosome-associated heat shock protein Hsp15